MRGIILAGGLGTRLRPLTLVTNKHLLGVYNQPMIYYPVQYLRDAGVENIMIVTGKECCGDFMKLLGSGRDLGVNLVFKVQEEADGIAGALKLCQDFARNDKVVVVLGDNLLENGIEPIVQEYRRQEEQGAMISVIEVPDPQRFGVATLDERGQVVRLIEKPQNPETNLAVIGVYIYDSEVWEIIPTLIPSARGEYEITDVNQVYMKRGKLHCAQIQGWWSDAGTITSLHHASQLICKSMKEKANGRGK